MIKTFLKWLIRVLTRLTYERVTLDKVNSKLIRQAVIVNGVQYYEFVNAADMPDSRFVHYLNFIKEFNQGMTNRELVEYFNKIIEANDKNETSRVGSLAFMAIDTITNVTPVEACFNLASLFYFDKDEDLKCYDGDYNEQKIRAFKSMPVEEQAFFLTQLFERSLKIPGGKLPTDIVGYLNISRVKLKAYERIRSGKFD